MKPEIRKARPEDIEQITLIEKEGVNLWTSDNFIREFTNSFSLFIVALDKKKIIGFAVAWNVSDGIELNNISVKKEFRRHGIASLMIDHIKKTLKNGEPVDIFLEVAEKNIEARSFYKKLGFIETGIRKNYYKNDNAIQMKLDKNAQI